MPTHASIIAAMTGSMPMVPAEFHVQEEAIPSVPLVKAASLTVSTVALLLAAMVGKCTITVAHLGIMPTRPAVFHVPGARIASAQPDRAVSQSASIAHSHALATTITVGRLGRMPILCAE